MAEIYCLHNMNDNANVVATGSLEELSRIIKLPFRETQIAYHDRRRIKNKYFIREQKEKRSYEESFYDLYDEGKHIGCYEFFEIMDLLHIRYQTLLGVVKSGRVTKQKYTLEKRR